MKYHLVNFPRYFSKSDYDKVIGKVVDYLSDQREVKSIYQTGSISNPGISDIDLLVVFDKEKPCHINPLTVLKKNEIYPFTHSVFGINEKFVDKKYKHCFSFHNLNRLFGEEFEAFQTKNMVINNEEIKRQIALEYLFMNYIARSMEKTYRVLSIRNIMLSAKAMLFDLDFLGINSGNFYEILRELITIRQEWIFERNNSDFCEWYSEFINEFFIFATDTFEKDKLYVKDKRNYKFSRNVIVSYGENLGFKHKGVVLPGIISLLHKKSRKLNNRINRFNFFCPMRCCNSKELSERIFMSQEIVKSNKEYFPSFIAPVSGFLFNIVK